MRKRPDSPHAKSIVTSEFSEIVKANLGSLN